MSGSSSLPVPRIRSSVSVSGTLRFSAYLHLFFVRYTFHRWHCLCRRQHQFFTHFCCFISDGTFYFFLISTSFSLFKSPKPKIIFAKLKSDNCNFSSNLVYKLRMPDWCTLLPRINFVSKTIK